jgi:hypothetical protein
LREGHILFHEHEPGDQGARNSHYGKYVWVLHQRLPRVPKWVEDIAMEYYDVSRAQARKGLNPRDIVDSAEMWDNDGFASEVWSAREPNGFRTPDGAVVLNWRGLKIEGPIGEKEYYRRYDPDFDEDWYLD